MQQQGALASVIYPKLTNSDSAENVPDAALKAVNAQPSRENVYNYIVKNDDGTITQGRSLDGGKTDAVTNKPLPPTAQLLSPSNAGGAGSMLPPGGLDQSQKNRLITQLDAHQNVAGLASQLRAMAEHDPQFVGATGNVIRGVQEFMDVGNGATKLFGGQQQFQQAYQQAAQALKQQGVSLPNGLSYDPKASAIVKLNTILVYQQARALNGSGVLSKSDVEDAIRNVGDPSSWLQGPTQYAAGLRTIEDYARGQSDRINQQLKSGNIGAGQPNAPAAPAQPQGGAVVKWGRDAKGNPVRLSQ